LNTGSFPTALQFAAYHGELSLARFLLDKGANINTEGDTTSVLMITSS
jgi:ankyrin repeat protein